MTFTSYKFKVNYAGKRTIQSEVTRSKILNGFIRKTREPGYQNVTPYDPSHTLTGLIQFAKLS